MSAARPLTALAHLTPGHTSSRRPCGFYGSAPSKLRLAPRPCGPSIQALHSAAAQQQRPRRADVGAASAARLLARLVRRPAHLRQHPEECELGPAARARRSAAPRLRPLARERAYQQERCGRVPHRCCRAQPVRPALLDARLLRRAAAPAATHELHAIRARLFPAERPRDLGSGALECGRLDPRPARVDLHRHRVPRGLRRLAWRAGRPARHRRAAFRAPRRRLCGNVRQVYAATTELELGNYTQSIRTLEQHSVPETPVLSSQTA